MPAGGLAAALQAKYASKETDEFFKPIVVTDGDVDAKADGTGTGGVPVGRIQDGDVVLLFDFRADRMRELASVLGMGHFPFEKLDDEGRSSTVKRKGLRVFTMTQYDSKHTMPVLFKPVNMRDGLSEWVSKRGLPQYHVAETEKYAHVTFFFNGGIEAVFAGEDRLTVMSPKHVSTYDQVWYNIVRTRAGEGVSGSPRVTAAFALSLSLFDSCHLLPFLSLARLPSCPR